MTIICACTHGPSRHRNGLCTYDWCECEGWITVQAVMCPGCCEWLILDYEVVVDFSGNPVRSYTTQTEHQAFYEHWDSCSAQV